MFDFLFQATKKRQLDMIDQIFEMLRGHVTLFGMSSTSERRAWNRRLLHVLQKMARQFVLNNYRVKVCRTGLKLIERFNYIQDKRAELDREPDIEAQVMPNLVRVSNEDDEDEEDDYGGDASS